MLEVGQVVVGVSRYWLALNWLGMRCIVTLFAVFGGYDNSLQSPYGLPSMTL